MENQAKEELESLRKGKLTDEAIAAIERVGAEISSQYKS
jgi:hypothetical protein